MGIAGLIGFALLADIERPMYQIAMSDLRLDDLRQSIGSFWESGLALLLLLMVVVSGILAAFSRPDYGQERHEGLPVVATITRIVASGSKYHPYMRAVTVQDGGGVDHYLTVPVDMIAGCKVGDKVKAIRSSAALTLPSTPCRKDRADYKR